MLSVNICPGNARIIRNQKGYMKNEKINFTVILITDEG